MARLLRYCSGIRLVLIGETTENYRLEQLEISPPDSDWIRHSWEASVENPCHRGEWSPTTSRSGTAVTSVRLGATRSCLPFLAGKNLRKTPLFVGVGSFTKGFDSSCSTPSDKPPEVGVFGTSCPSEQQASTDVYTAIFLTLLFKDHSNPIFAMEHVTAFRIFLSRSARIARDRDRIKKCLWSCDFLPARPRKTRSAVT